MNLQEFFHDNPKAAIAFSGGVDSAYLLYAALACGADVRAYFVKSQFQPEFELEDACQLAEELEERFGCSGILKVLQADVLADPVVTANPPDRCYHCKQKVFGKILDAAAQDGYHLILDGTNASDEEGDRPGMRALREMKVRSPLRICGLTKAEIRRLSQEADLFTWSKPSYACLATRVPTGRAITAEDLVRVEGAEKALTDMGFSDFRVRLYHDAARIQLPADQMTRAVTEKEKILDALKPSFAYVLIDLEGR